ncbi:MAG: lysophospholipid acyltransferase family protein [Aquisalimonadaceae bacterium]
MNKSGPLSSRTTAEKVVAFPRSVLWLLGTFGATVFFGTVGLVIAATLPYRRRYWFFTQWSFFVLWWARVCCGIRYVVEGKENIPETPGIVMAKHQSAWETLALQYWFSPQTWVLKQELLKIPLIGWALGLLAPIAIDRSARKAAMQQMMEQGLERLNDGRWVVVFPEGTRVPAGHCGRYRKGGAVLATETGYAVVPVAHNAGEFWPKNSFLKFPGTVRVRIGKPIEPQGRSAELLIEDVKTWIETNTRAVSGYYQEE